MSTGVSLEMQTIFFITDVTDAEAAGCGVDGIGGSGVGGGAEWAHYLVLDFEATCEYQQSSPKSV